LIGWLSLLSHLDRFGARRVEYIWTFTTFSILANTIHQRRRASDAKKGQLRRIASLAALLLASTEVAARADDLPSLKAPPTASGNPWSGFFVGGHLGYAWGDSSELPAESKVEGGRDADRLPQLSVFHPPARRLNKKEQCFRRP
jgi:hypothetical protein